MGPPKSCWQGEEVDYCSFVFGWCILRSRSLRFGIWVYPHDCGCRKKATECLKAPRGSWKCLASLFALVECGPVRQTSCVKIRGPGQKQKVPPCEGLEILRNTCGCLGSAPCTLDGNYEKMSLLFCSFICYFTVSVCFP